MTSARVEVPRILTPAQFAEATQLPRKTVIMLCARGDIPGARKLGRVWRIPAWAVDELFRRPERAPVVADAQPSGAQAPRRAEGSRRARAPVGRCDARETDLLPFLPLAAAPNGPSRPRLLHVMPRAPKR